MIVYVKRAIAPGYLGLAVLIAIGCAPPVDAEEVPVKVSGAFRLRYEAHQGRGGDYMQSSIRGTVGVDLHFDPASHVYVEVGSGQVRGGPGIAPPNNQNSASLQQAYFEFRDKAGASQMSFSVGRQEFAEGPRQLISVGDGANLHRTWNGAKVEMRKDESKIGAFAFKATRLKRGFLDDGIDDDEQLRGFYAGTSLLEMQHASVRVDAFWFDRIKTSETREKPRQSSAISTFGVKGSGHVRQWAYEFTLAKQTGSKADRVVSAWAFFASQRLELSEQGWKPRLVARVDAASGGPDSGKLRSFDQLYASSSYLGEGRFLSLRNLLLVTGGISLSPTYSIEVSADLGIARRMTEADAVYGGGMKEFAGTRRRGDLRIGELLRVTASWHAKKNLIISAAVERLLAGPTLRHAGFGPAGYASVSALFQFDQADRSLH